MIPRAYQNDSAAPWNETRRETEDPDRVYEREAEKRLEEQREEQRRIEQEAKAVTEPEE